MLVLFPPIPDTAIIVIDHQDVDAGISVDPFFASPSDPTHEEQQAMSRPCSTFHIC